MEPSARSICSFLLFFVGFLISGSLTSPVSDDLTERTVAGRCAGSKFLSIENKDNRYFLAGLDGTICLMDNQSSSPRWELATGPPFAYSGQSSPDLEYFIDFGDNGHLYEYSKAFGRQELHLTLKELVHREPLVRKGSRFTVGAEETTLIFVNESNGEVFSRQRMLTSELKVRSWPRTTDGYIILLRTDYKLICIDLHTMPAVTLDGPLWHISHSHTVPTKTSDGPLWYISHSHISAAYIQNGISSNVGLKSMPASSHKIPIIFPPINSKQRVLVAPPTFTGSIFEYIQSPTETNKILEVQASNYLSGCSVADKLTITEKSNGFGNPQLVERCPDDNTSTVLQNITKDTDGHEAKYDHVAKQNFYEMLHRITHGIVVWLLNSVLLVILVLLLLKCRAQIKKFEEFSNLRAPKSTTTTKRKG